MYNSHSVYCYPKSDVLINKLDIHDAEKLERAESQLTLARLSQLSLNPIIGKWDLSHFEKIHKFIFQDVYPFAGEIRRESIAKGNFQFAVPMFIEGESERIFGLLKQENYLSGLNKPEMCERLAYYYSEINVLHPFREGNGRAEREFFRTLTLKNGYTMNWSNISRPEFMRASVESTVNDKAFIPVMKKVILEDHPEKSISQQWKKIIHHNRLNRDQGRNR